MFYLKAGPPNAYYKFEKYADATFFIQRFCRGVEWTLSSTEFEELEPSAYIEIDYHYSYILSDEDEN